MTALSPEVSDPEPIAADQHALSPSAAALLINIDNGGTLTDFCVIDGANEQTKRAKQFRRREERREQSSFSGLRRPVA
jgi:hypothetical protein